MRQHYLLLLPPLLFGCAPGSPLLSASVSGAVDPVEGAFASAEETGATGVDRWEFEAVDGGFQAHLPGLFDARLDASGVVAERHGDSVGLRTVGYGREAFGAADPVTGGCAVGEDPSDVRCVRQVELDHGAVTEWWVSRPEGLEQGWTLHEPPAGAGVTIDVEVTGGVASVDADGAGATLTGSTGQRWRYRDLTAWDADGRPVAARLSAAADGLRVTVDTAGARWPVTVDPTLSSTEERLVSSAGAVDDSYGVAVASSGDFDGDGYADAVVGVNRYGATGSVFVYYGAASGIDSATEQEIYASDAIAYDYFGYSVASAHDLNGDGYDDLVVGAYGSSDGGGFSGAVYVYYGSAAGLDVASEQKLVTTDAAAADYFGSSVVGVGDIDGDGYDDIAAGADGDDDGGSRGGSVYVYYGGASGVDSTSEQKITASDTDSFDYFGYAIAGPGDLNGDGYADLVAGAYGDEDNGDYSGSVYVYYGSAAGIDTASEQKVTPSDGDIDDSFGAALSRAGDLDGDGYDDLAVGAYGDELYTGAVYVYPGSAAGIDVASELKVVASDGQADDSFGASVAQGGDVNGDGYDDLAVGAYGESDNGWYAGAVYVYAGSASGLDTSTEERLTPTGGETEDYYGYSVAGGGDMNGDGYSDLLVGSFGEDAYTGAAYVYYGSCVDLDADGTCDISDCDDTDADVGGPDPWYADTDADGYGDPASVSYACAQPVGYVDDASDCDDSDAAFYPGADEEDCADPNDYNCDGTVDYTDADGDGWADCVDCDDSAADVNPDADEVCNEVDDDCDGTVDGAESVDLGTWYADGDGDGWTDEAVSVVECTAPDGYFAASESPDCDDTDSAIYPGAEDILDDGIDQDCDGVDATSDTGTPGDDTGTPGDDTGTPTDDTGTPTDDTGTPTDDTGTPADDTGTPADDTGEPGKYGGGCGSCDTSGSPAGGGALLVLALAALRRRRSV